MVITNRDLAIGTRLIAKFKGNDFHGLVQAGPDGAEDGQSRLYAVQEIPDKVFKSPSAAGSACMNGIACNGWRFWSVEGQEGTMLQRASADNGERLLANRATKRQDAATAAQEPTPPAERKRRGGKKPIRVLSFLKGDNTKYWCSACQAAYPIEVGELIPDACPEGHRADDPEFNSPAPAQEYQGETPLAVEMEAGAEEVPV